MHLFCWGFSDNRALVTLINIIINNKFRVDGRECNLKIIQSNITQLYDMYRNVHKVSGHFYFSLYISYKNIIFKTNREVVCYLITLKCYQKHRKFHSFIVYFYIIFGLAGRKKQKFKWRFYFWLIPICLSKIVTSPFNSLFKSSAL